MVSGTVFNPAKLPPGFVRSILWVWLSRWKSWNIVQYAGHEVSMCCVKRQFVQERWHLGRQWQGGVEIAWGTSKNHLTPKICWCQDYTCSSSIWRRSRRWVEADGESCVTRASAAAWQFQFDAKISTQGRSSDVHKRRRAAHRDRCEGILLW